MDTIAELLNIVESTRAIVNDKIHGIISISQIEYDLLQTRIINRLHHVKQLSFINLIYPAATHTRFEHSIGVMKVADTIFERVSKSIKRHEFLKFPRNREKMWEWANINYLNRAIGNVSNQDTRIVTIDLNIAKAALRLAALLHDIGHLPFAHAAEKIAMESEDINTRYGKDIKRYKFTDLHEYYGFMIILNSKEIRDVLKENFKKFNDVIINEVDLALLLVPWNNIKDDKEKDEVYKDIISRYGNAHVNRIGAELLHQIIGDSIDADKLDYLQRDSISTGTVYGFVDYRRIITGIDANIKVENDEIVQADIKISEKVRPAIEDLIDARIKMFKVVYYHHKSIILELLLSKIIEELKNEPVKDILNLDNNMINRLIDLFDYKAILYLSENNIYLGDNELLFIINIILNKNKKYGNNIYNHWISLINRKYIPVSLVKREQDFRDILRKSIENAISILENAEKSKNINNIVIFYETYDIRYNETDNYMRRLTSKYHERNELVKLFENVRNYLNTVYKNLEDGNNISDILKEMRPSGKTLKELYGEYFVNELINMIDNKNIYCEQNNHDIKVKINLYPVFIIKEPKTIEGVNIDSLKDFVILYIYYTLLKEQNNRYILMTKYQAKACIDRVRNLVIESISKILLSPMFMYTFSYKKNNTMS